MYLTKIKKGAFMKHLRNIGILILYSFFSLIFIPADAYFVLAFLSALSLCCIGYYAKSTRIILVLYLFFFILSFMHIHFLCFFAPVCYILFLRKCYPGAILCVFPFFYYMDTFDPSSRLFLFLLFGIALSWLLQQDIRSYEALLAEYKSTRDNEYERNLLLNEKNQHLLEKQDYEIYTATLSERNRIAREIHDNVGHLLSRSIIMVGAVSALNQNDALKTPLSDLNSTLNSAMDNIRSSVHDLHDEAVNLEEVIQNLIDEFTFCPVTFSYDVDKNVPREIKYSFITIVKEALNNIMRHSNATKAEILIREHPAIYQLCIEDNGTNIQLKNTGIGLSNMKERVRALKGNIQFLTEKGFQIFITIPKDMEKGMQNENNNRR